MTQIINHWSPVPASGPLSAQVVVNRSVGIQLYVRPMDTVEAAREEFGATIVDAYGFIEGVCCTECAVEASETREGAFQRACISCGDAGCGCVVFEDPHAPDTFYCTDCRPHCLCRECDPD